MQVLYFNKGELEMKKLVLIAAIFLALIASPCLAGETFTLTTPVTVNPQAYGGEITGYEIIPGSGGRFIIHFRWKDDAGDVIGLEQTVEWSGSDFTDIFGFVIRTQDVGVTIGVGLRDLVHNKIEVKYGVVID